MRHGLGAFLLGLAVAAAAPAAAQAPPEDDQETEDAADYGGLPAGEGRDLVYGVCTACHSARLVMQQGMSRSRWQKTLTWMQEEQGMPELPPEQMDTILDYLAAQFPEDRRRPTQPGLTPRPTGRGFQPLMPAD